MFACATSVFDNRAPAPVVLEVQSRNAALYSFVTSQIVTLPSGINVGDLLLVFYACGSTNTASVDTSYSGSNWSQIKYATPGSTPVLRVLAKIAEGADALKMTLSGGGEWSSSQCLRITGCDSLGKVYIDSDAAGGTYDPPSLTPAFGVSNYLAVAALTWIGTTDGVVTSNPSGYSNTNTTGAAGATNRPGGSTCEKTLSSVASENPGVFTMSNSNANIGTTVMIRG